MRYPAHCLMFAAVSALILGAASVALTHADDAPAVTTGTLSGTVVDQDGNPVSGARLTAIKAEDLRGGRKQDPNDPTDDPTADTKPARRPDPAATTDSGSDGSFKFADIPAGKYAILAVLRGTGRGRAKGPLEVTAGQNTDAGAITLTPPGAKKAGGGRQKGGGAADPNNN